MTGGTILGVRGTGGGGTAGLAGVENSTRVACLRADGAAPALAAPALAAAGWPATAWADTDLVDAVLADLVVVAVSAWGFPVLEVITVATEFDLSLADAGWTAREAVVGFTDSER